MCVPLKAQTLLLVLLLVGCDEGAPPTPRQRQWPFEQIHPAFSKRAPEDYWLLTRDCTVLIGTVSEANDRVSIRVEQVIKGEGVPESLSFPTPLVRPDNVEYERAVLRNVKFLPRERWILFLDTVSLHSYTLRDGASGDEVPRVELSVREFLAFAALPEERSRCAFLVQVAVARGLSWRPALQLLEQYNRAELLPVLAPLATDELGKRVYWDLLTRNPNPDATAILRKFAQSERPPLLSEVIDALGRRDRESDELSRELMSYLTHSDPLVRQSAVFILGVRDYRPAFPDIVLRLRDGSPDVRAFALAWPWYAYAKDHPDVVTQIKDMRSDPDPRVRSSAKDALGGISAWYRFWYFGR